MNFSQEDLDNLNIPNHLDLGQYWIKFFYEEDNVVFSSDFMSFNVIQDSEIPNIYIIAADFQFFKMEKYINKFHSFHANRRKRNFPQNNR